MYFFSFIVASIPLFFSHLIPGLAQYIAPNGSFERMKVYLFLILLTLSIIELIVFHMKRIEKYSLRQYSLFLQVLLFPLIVHLISAHEIDSLFFWGSYEKRHGYLLYL